MPFVSDLTLGGYAKTFRNETIEVGQFVAGEARAEAARAAFWQDCVYLGRYREVVEACVRAILTPDFPLPAFLTPHDYAGGRPPSPQM